MKKRMSSSRVNLEKYLIPLDEINRATENFNQERCIGGGGFGLVYKGQLSERWQNCTAAVKRLAPDSYQGEHEFRNELKMISKFHHENIISFIGYCDENKEMIIVYEYAINGSLDHHLQDPNKMSCITWRQRLKICIGAAKGLNYLHSGLGERNRVIHRDVKSGNILLDDNMVAKICDFGLSRFGQRNQPDTQLYTKVAGTQFYMDPTYHESRILRKESDVYSFGVVLFEILSGMLVYDERNIGNERQFLMTTVRRYHQNEPDKVIDPYIRDQINIRCFDTFQEIAYQCISFNIKERPALDTVVNKIEEALSKISEHPVNTRADDFAKETLLGKLKSIRPYDQWFACSEIICLIKINYKNGYVISKAGTIHLLTHMLNTGDSRTQEQALTAIYGLLYYEESTGIRVSFIAVPELLDVLNTCSMAENETTMKILYILSTTDYRMNQEDAVRCLMLMLSRFTETGKRRVMYVLNSFCINEARNIVAVRAGVVPVLMELFTGRDTDLKVKALGLLLRFSQGEEGRQAIDEAEGVPILVEVIGSSDRIFAANVAFILAEFCLDDQKYLVEFQELGIMDKMMDVLQNNKWDAGETKAKQLLEKIKDYHHDHYNIPDDAVVDNLETKLLNFLRWICLV